MAEVKKEVTKPAAKPAANPAVKPAVAAKETPAVKKLGRDGVFIDKNKNNIDDEIDAENMKRGRAARSAGKDLGKDGKTVTAKRNETAVSANTKGGKQ
jgi:hypothetical protein